MTFFVDATAVLGSAIDGPQREPCLRLLDAVARGAPGRTSALVLEQVWHIERSGAAGAIAGLAEYAQRIFTPLLPVGDEAFVHALGLLAPALGTSDRLHVGTCRAHELTTLVSANDELDGIDGLRRIDPSHAQTVERLLRESPR